MERSEVTRVKKTKRYALLAIAMSLILAAGMMLPGVRTRAEESAAEVVLPDPVAETGRLKIYEREDFADAELKAILGAKELETEPLTALLDETYTLKGETPDLVLILSDGKDEALPGGKEMGVNDAKKIVNHLRAAVGNDVPILWTALTEADAPVSSGKVFSFVQEMEDSVAYPNIYANYTLYHQGLQADRNGLAKRIVLPMTGRGFLNLNKAEEPEPAYKDVVFYISENGNDKAGGMSPDQPLLTGSGFVNRIRAIYGKDLKGLPVDTRIVIEVTGEIQFSKTSQTVFGIFAGNSLPRDTEGKKVPVLIETYQYNGQNRATIRGDYLPHDEGSSRMSIESPATFRNIKIASASTTGGLAMHNFFVTAATVVFDNTTFEARNAKGFSLSPSNNCWTKDYEVSEGTIVETEIVLKNGVYDHTTGVGIIAGLNTNSLWRSADNGGSILEGKMLRNRVIVGEGAKVGNLYALNGKLPINSVEIVVKDGGEVRSLSITPYNRSETIYQSDVKVLVNGGFISRDLHGIGQQGILQGDVYFELKNSTVQGRPEDELEYSDMLGDEFSAVEGIFNFSMQNVLFSMISGLNTPSSIFAGGYYAGIPEGKYNASYENVAFIFVPNPTLTSSDTYLHFGPVGGIIAADYELSLQSVIADTSLIETSEIRFGAEEASVAYLKTIIGEKGHPEKGAAFYGGELYLGGEGNYFGKTDEESAGQTSGETVFELSVSGTAFHNEKVYLTPVWVDDTDKGVNGSMKAAFDGASFADEFLLANGAVFGDLTVTLNGVSAEHLTTGFISPREETVKVTTETGESEKVVTSEFDQLVRKAFTINGVNASEFLEYCYDDEANEIAFVDGVSTVRPEEPSNGSEGENGEGGGNENRNFLSWPVIAGIGGGVVLAVLAAVLLVLRKKKKGSTETKKD